VPGMNRALRYRPALRRAFLALLAAGLLTLLVAEGRDTRFAPTAVATVVSGGLCAGAVVVPRERLPRWAALAVGASCVLSVVSANLSQRPEHTPGMLELCALLALVARAVRHFRPVRGTATVAGAGVAVALVPLRLSDAGDEALALLESALSLCVLTAVLVGLCLWLRDRLRARERQSIRQAQRLEYARELHDFVAHHVTAIVAQTKAARFTAAQGRAQDPAALDRMLEDIESAAARSLSSMRSMVSVLRSRDPLPAPPDEGLAEVLGRAADEFSAYGPPSVTVTVDPELTARRLPPVLVDVANRVVREALTNARRHARGATSVVVAAGPRPGPPARLEVSVTDDGRLPGPRQPDATGGGFGLMGLTERVEGAGGRFTAGPGEDAGWSVAAQLPLPPAA